MSMIKPVAKEATANHENNHMISKLFRVMETMALINSTKDMQQLINLILRAVKEVMEVEASSLARVDTYRNELFFSDTAGGSDKIKNLRLKIGEGIAGRVARTRSPMIVNDVSTNKYHYSAADRQTSFTTKKILCVPLIVQERVIGILQALNKLDGTNFNTDDLRIFNAFANQVSVAMENARLNALAVYDELTGIHNRRYFNLWMEQEFSRVRRFESNLSLIMIDIDNFKGVNDTYGHLAGDFVLIKLVKILNKHIRRKADLFVRLGGDEFIIALQETNLSKACILAEKFRSTVEETEFNYQGKIIPVRVSLGVANYKKNPVNTVDLFIKCADDMLYRAKKNGRNQVQVFLGN